MGVQARQLESWNGVGGEKNKSLESTQALVTGAMGPVMVRHLIDAGYAVRALSRSSPAPDTLPRSVEYWAGDICDREFMRRAVKGVQVVFHLAARLHVTNPGPKLHADYQRVNVEGTRSVVDALCGRTRPTLDLFQHD